MFNDARTHQGRWFNSVFPAFTLHEFRKDALWISPFTTYLLPFLISLCGYGVGTQEVALNALNCFYRKFLGIPFETLSFRHARKPVRVPVVFSDLEARRIIAMLEALGRLMAEIMYGTGLRVSETLRLRIKDIDFDQGMMIVREGLSYACHFVCFVSHLYKAKHIAPASRGWIQGFSGGCNGFVFLRSRAHKTIGKDAPGPATDGPFFRMRYRVIP